MPKQRITKEMVVDVAFEIARSRGVEQVMVKTIADKLGCSVQPIYSYCKNMEGLRQDVMERTQEFIREYVAKHMDKNDLFRSMGNTYVQMAKEEPHLFNMFILHKREGISSLEALYRSESNPAVAEFIAGQMNISVAQAKQLHLNMIIYTLGVGILLSTTTPGIPVDEILSLQETAHEAFVTQAQNRQGEK